jgi:hypothetical protein
LGCLSPNACLQKQQAALSTPAGENNIKTEKPVVDKAPKKGILYF